MDSGIFPVRRYQTGALVLGQFRRQEVCTAKRDFASAISHPLRRLDAEIDEVATVGRIEVCPAADQEQNFVPEVYC